MIINEMEENSLILFTDLRDEYPYRNLKDKLVINENIELKPLRFEESEEIKKYLKSELSEDVYYSMPYNNINSYFYIKYDSENYNDDYLCSITGSLYNSIKLLFDSGIICIIQNYPNDEIRTCTIQERLYPYIHPVRQKRYAMGKNKKKFQNIHSDDDNEKIFCKSSYEATYDEMKKYFELLMHFELLMDIEKKEKLNLMLEKYNFATSALQIPDTNRFIELTTILEKLYLTQEDRREKKRPLKGRIYKILEEDEQLIHDLYNIRSSIVHSGIPKIEKSLPNEYRIHHETEQNLSFSQFQNWLSFLANITRKSLLLYLDKSIKEEKENIFTEKNLKSICNPNKTKCNDKNSNKFCKDCKCEVKS